HTKKQQVPSILKDAALRHSWLEGSTHAVDRICRLQVQASPKRIADCACETQLCDRRPSGRRRNTIYDCHHFFSFHREGETDCRTGAFWRRLLTASNLFCPLRLLRPTGFNLASECDALVPPQSRPSSTPLRSPRRLARRMAASDRKRP